MIAQSPAATIDVAIAVDPLAGIPLDKVLCTPATKTKADGRTIYGLTDGPLPAPVTVLFTDKATQAGRDHVAALKQAHADIDVQDETASAADALAQTLADQVDAAGDADRPGPWQTHLVRNQVDERVDLDLFGTPELKTYLNDTGLGNHPDLVKAFVKIGKAMSEDGMVDGSNQGQRSAAEVLYGK